MSCEFVLCVYICFLVLVVVGSVVWSMPVIGSKLMLKICLVLAILGLISYPLYFYGEIQKCATKVEIEYVQPPELKPPCDFVCPYE